MKNIIYLFLATLVFSACSNDVQTNSPAFQAKFNDATWRASDARVSIDLDGSFVITAYTKYETIVLRTSSGDPGTYVLGTTNQDNYVSYDFDGQGVLESYDTSSANLGPVYKISNVVNPGTGYVNDGAARVSGGSGTGMILNARSNAGVITYASLLNNGQGYEIDDIVTIVGGSSDATLKINNVSHSTGSVISFEILTGGSNYTDTGYGALTTTNGAGSGLKLAILANNNRVASAYILSRGDGYKAGDLVTVESGDGNATFRVLNTQQSNGEIVIEEVHNGKYTGTFKFNAVSSSGEVITFSNGVFYKVSGAGL